jgi:hypothetical protein
MSSKEETTMHDSTERPSYEPAPVESAGTVAIPRLGAAKRMWMAFTSPGQVFTDISIRPTWVLCLIAMVLLGLMVQFAVLPHVDAEATLRARLGDRADGVSDEQIEKMVTQSEKFTRFAPVIALVVSPIVWAIMAAVFFVLLKIVGSDVDYQRAFSTALHAYWPPALVVSILTAVLVQRVGKIPQEELANLVKSHPGAFLSPDAPTWLSAAAGTLSVFNIWTVVLLVIGFRIVGRISTGKALVVALVPWLVWLVAKAGFTAVFT